MDSIREKTQRIAFTALMVAMSATVTANPTFFLGKVPQHSFNIEDIRLVEVGEEASLVTPSLFSEVGGSVGKTRPQSQTNLGSGLQYPQTGLNFSSGFRGNGRSNNRGRRGDSNNGERPRRQRFRNGQEGYDDVIHQTYIVPAPSSILLGSAGLAFVSLIRKRHAKIAIA